MENLRAYTVVETFKEFCREVYYVPENIIEDDNACDLIRREGLKLFIKCDKSYEEVEEILKHTVFLKNFELVYMDKGCDISDLKVNSNLNEHIVHTAFQGKQKRQRINPVFRIL